MPICVSNVKLITMIKIKCFLTIFLATCIIVNSAAQDRTVTGIVTAFDSIALVGAKIKVKSSKQVTETDSIGNFTIHCKPEDVIWVTARGYYTRKVKLAPSVKLAAINLNLSIKPGKKNLEYAIGYGKVSEQDKLNALAQLNSSETDFSSYNSIYELIQGRFAGVVVENGEIYIRGKKSLLSSNAALIVLDGMTVDNSVLFTLPVTQVKSIDVIKDGGAAVYGSRGANGVVIIETKKK